MHRLLFLLSLFTLHSSLFSAPAPQLLRATLVGDNQLAPGATLTAQSGSTITLASGSTFTAPANLLDWAAVNKSGSSLSDLATRPWSALTGTPTTLAGYGITDAYASPLTTAGDLLYGGTAGAPTRLGIGTTGQVLSVSSGGLPAWSTLSGTGTVTSITAGTGLTGGTITSTGTIGLDTSGVTAGSYGSASAVPVLTVDATGRITSASTASITAGGTGDVTGPSSATSGRLAVFSGTTGKVIADSSTLTVSGGTLTGSGSMVLSPASGSTVDIGSSSARRNMRIYGTLASGLDLMATTDVALQVAFYIGSATAAAFGIATGPGYYSIDANSGDFVIKTYDNDIIFGTQSAGNLWPARLVVDGEGEVRVGAYTDNGSYAFQINGNSYQSGAALLANTTDSTSPTTGALVVSGGAGIAGRTSTGSLAISTTGTPCDGMWSATATLDFGSIAAAAQADLTITVTGASTGDSVSLGLPASPTAGIVFNAFVSAANTVKIRATNITAAAIDPASATYRATVSSF